MAQYTSCVIIKCIEHGLITCTVKKKSRTFFSSDYTHDLLLVNRKCVSLKASVENSHLTCSDLYVIYFSPGVNLYWSLTELRIKEHHIYHY